MGREQVFGDLANPVALVHPSKPPGVFKEVDHVENLAGGKDVVLAVDVADMLAVGVIDAGFGRGDSLEGGAPGELVPVQLVKVQWEGEGSATTSTPSHGPSSARMEAKR